MVLWLIGRSLSLMRLMIRLIEKLTDVRARVFAGLLILAIWGGLELFRWVYLDWLSQK